MPRSSQTVWSRFFTSALALALGHLLAAVPFATASAATQTVELVEFLVTAPAPAAVPPATPEPWLGEIPGVIFSGQGFGSQNDLSIRGSSFHEAGLSLHGLALANPQTEHFNAELPVPLSLFGPPDVRTGLEQATRGGGHLVGAVALELLPIANLGRVTIGGSDHPGSWAEAVVQGRRSLGGGGGAFGAGAFVGMADLSRVDGAGNDLERSTMGGRVQWAGDGARADALLAAGHKAFGARGYYGVTPDWDAREKIEDTLFLATARARLGERCEVRAGALRRDLRDEYTLFWNRPGVYRNRHDSTLSAATLAADGRASDSFALHGGLSGVGETLDSNRLGDHHRGRAAFTLLPEHTWGAWGVAWGARAEAADGDAPRVLPQAGIRHTFPCGTVAELSYSESVQPPSYTALAYDSPGSLGDAGLESESCRAVEAGMRGRVAGTVGWRAAGFARETRDTVDWVLATPDATRWTAVNLGAVRTHGGEMEADARLGGGVSVAASYQYVKKETDSDFHASRYALDYPEHAARLAARWRVSPAWRVEAGQGYRRQTANPARRGPDEQFEGWVGAQFAPPFAPGCTLALRLDNVWDDDFQDMPGQDTSAGRRTLLSGSAEW